MGSAAALYIDHNGSARRTHPVHHNLYAGGKLRRLIVADCAEQHCSSWFLRDAILYMTLDIEAARQQMIEQQIRAWEVLDEQVLDTIQAVRREQFVPESYRELAFADTPIPLGHGQQMLTPQLEGKILQALTLGFFRHRARIDDNGVH